MLNIASRALVFFCAITLLSGCGMSMEEKELYEINAPDKSFKLIVTQTWQGTPYGVQGKIYISDWNRNKKRFVTNYFEDFDDDLLVENRIVWQEETKSFQNNIFKDRISLINIESFPLDSNLVKK